MRLRSGKYRGCRSTAVDVCHCVAALLFFVYVVFLFFFLLRYTKQLTCRVEALLTIMWTLCEILIYWAFLYHKKAAGVWKWFLTLTILFNGKNINAIWHKSTRNTVNRIYYFMYFVNAVSLLKPYAGSVAVKTSTLLLYVVWANVKTQI